MTEDTMTEGPRPPVDRVGRAWRVAVLANIKDENQPKPHGVPADAYADFDHIETIDAIRRAIETDGHRTEFLAADATLPQALSKFKPDICFNMAEGVGGDAREALVPALLELLAIPYTGSRVQTNAISLDKTLTKRIWRDRRLPVAPFQEFTIGDESLRPELNFPLFVKPAREGTGMGVDAHAVVSDETELRDRVRWTIETYAQPALVEKFLPGREFTVGVLGRRDARLFGRHPEWYEKDGFHQFPVLDVDTRGSVTPNIYSQEAKSINVGGAGAPAYLCPADIPPDVAKKFHHLARRAHSLLGALDVSRTDVRMDADGNPRLLEINTLPGLTAGYSDLCIEASAEGISYTDLILEILYLAAGRWGLLEPREMPQASARKKQSR
jgi:D-alanine-D-alanine ligase